MMFGKKNLRKCSSPLKWVFVALSAVTLLTACDDHKHFVPELEEDGNGNSQSNMGSSSSVPNVVITDEPVVEDTTAVSDVNQLPKCTSANEGESFMVATENTLYFCVGGEWNKDAVEVLGVSCADGKLVLGATEVEAVEDSTSFGYDTTAKAMVYRREGVNVVGIVEKGPFLHGTSVKLVELDSAKRMVDSPRIHKTCITSSDGSYSLGPFNLVSPYVRVEVSGYYKNELTGGLSSEPITLRNITDLTEKDTVNVNVLTHLEAGRTWKMAENSGFNQPIRTVKEQALKDVLKSFLIFIPGFNDQSVMGGLQKISKTADEISLFDDGEFSAALIAISIMMQRNGAGQEMLNYANAALMTISGNGDWNDNAARADLADWLMVMDTSGVYPVIRRNLESVSNGATVPDFEKYLRNFWYTIYRFPTCSSASNGTVIHIPESQSAFFACNYTCEGSPTIRFTCDAGLGRWRAATDIEKDTVGLGADTSKYDGAIRPGVINKDKSYIYEASKKQWRAATSNDIMDFTDVADVYNGLAADESVVFVLRHAERTNETGSKGHLTDNGKAQAKSVGAKFKYAGSIHFAYSGYTRTLETCEGIASGAGVSASPEILDGLDGNWYVKNGDPSIESLTSWAYTGKPAGDFYDLELRSQEFVSSYILTRQYKLQKVNFYISHDMMVLPFAVYASQGKVDLRFFDVQGTRNWLNFLAGVAVIYNTAGKVRYVPVRGLDSGTMKL